MFILIAILFSFSLIGCNKEQISDTAKNNLPPKTEPSKDVIKPSSAEGERITVPKEIKLVKKPNKTKYLLSNGIEIQRNEKTITTKKGNLPILIPKIYGLKDKAIEENLNKSIEKDIEKEVNNLADERAEIPMALFPNIELNANNLLSISLRDLYSAPLYGFLYRLTDGKRLYVKDIFTEGTDYISFINQKVVEGILMKEGEEEDNLSKPFSTINQDQNFVLSEDALYIVFHAGEEGFLRRDSVRIPLSKIDDYIDVLDRYSGTERKTQEKQDLIIRKNNIFFTNKSEITKKANGNVWIYYPEILGLRDQAFEELINKNIKNLAFQTANNKFMDGLVKVNDQRCDYVALIQMQVCFNYYGVLCIRRDVSGFDMSKDFQQFNTVYSYDLIKKKAINPKDMIKNYLAKNKAMEDIFIKDIKNEVSYRYNNITKESKDFIDSSVDYSFIMDKAQIYFCKYYNDDEMRILVHFNENTLKGISSAVDLELPFKDIIKGAPEDFFGW
jgi:hypothetical protein